MSDPAAATDFSPLEIGLLTVAERRGAVRTPSHVDEHSDPLGIERLTLLRRLASRGLLEEAGSDPAQAEFKITEAGCAALAAADSARPGDP